jgi:diguanylate cyclase (GGDEF)-like protein
MRVRRSSTVEPESARPGQQIETHPADFVDVAKFDVLPADLAVVGLPRRERGWNVAAWLLLAVLLIASVTSALAWRADVERDHRNVFDSTASAIASSAAATLRGRAEVARFEQVLLAHQPQLTNPQFTRWLTDLDVNESGSLGAGFVQLVPADRLEAFAKQVKADPPAGVSYRGGYEVFPGGARANYCLVRLMVWLGPAGQLPPTLDYCAPTIPGFGASPTANAFARARDTGALALTGPVVLFPGEIFAFLPVYRGGVTPPTVAQRRDLLVGWVAATFDGNSTLAAAQSGHHDMRVEVVANLDGRSVVLAANGEQPTGHVASLSVPIDRDGTWAVRVLADPTAGGVSPTGQAIAVGGFGALVSLLIFGVIQVLLRSRGRALRLVHERTEELRHRALHDDLTGLPNRAFILDRIEQLRSRARRHGTLGAVLFVDLDSFKGVNDRYGHGVGDALLRAVAARLANSLRKTDIAGRIGGDEFVVLVDETSLANGVGPVAQRLLGVLREPFEVAELPGVPLDVRASVGVALVGPDDEGDVLRNADTALYQAKAAGKSTFSVYGG